MQIFEKNLPEFKISYRSITHSCFLWDLFDQENEDPTKVWISHESNTSRQRKKKISMNFTRINVYVWTMILLECAQCSHSEICLGASVINLLNMYGYIMAISKQEITLCCNEIKAFEKWIDWCFEFETSPVVNSSQYRMRCMEVYFGYTVYIFFFSV